MNPLESFRAAMRRAGLDYAGMIPADGQLHRFKADGDRNKNSWFVLHAGPPMAGAFGCWRRNFKETWCEKSPKDYTNAEWREIQARWKQVDEAERNRRDRAQVTADWIFNRGTATTANHPYLVKKAVRPHGELRVYRGALALALRDTTGQLHSLQFIDADGTKRFLSGGRVAGCFFTLADEPDGPLAICEGYATGASIHEATGFATVAAMNCGNLLPVAEALRRKWPGREIIIAADNDQWKPPANPGAEAATAAAKAIRARLAIPRFRDTNNKPTDFNDLHQLEGTNTVKTQLESAQIPKETDAETFARLAAFSPVEYDRCREQEADALNIRVSTLDSEVERLREAAKSADSILQGRAVQLPEVEPWPEPINGAEVLTEISTRIDRYMVLPAGAADAMTLWAAHAHCFEAFNVTPRLNITAPERGCGKTLARDVMQLFVPRPYPAENLTAATAFRLVETYRPTLLADEYDSWLPQNEELRGILNAGHRRGGFVPRCVGDGNELRSFAVFCPAVLCGIGALPGTLHDRSVVIRLNRAKDGEVKSRFDSRRVEAERELCRKLARWIADNRAAIEACEPRLPDGAFNRVADNWRPLFAIAEIAGGDWPRHAAAAYAALTAGDNADGQSIGVILLADIRQHLLASGTRRIFSRDLVAGLTAMNDRPWPEASHGKPISENWLAKHLRAFGVTPKTTRIGTERLRGYEAADFADAFARYLPEPGISNRDTVTSDATAGSPTDNVASETVTSQNPVTDANTGEIVDSQRLSRCHDSDAQELLL